MTDKDNTLGNTLNRCSSLLAIIIFLTIIFWFTYWHVINGYWRYDDHDHLFTVHQLGSKGLYRLFTDKATWAQVSVANFCPINVSFYGLWDFGFNLNTRLAYFNHLFNLYLLAVAFFLYIRRYAGTLKALTFTTLWLSTQAVYEVANELMSNHYILAALLGLLSLHCFDIYQKQKRSGYLILGAILAFLAALTKDIFGIVAITPLAHYLMNLRINDSSATADKKGMIIPAILALTPLFLFALWRHAMLSGRVGGYKPPDWHLQIEPTTLIGPHTSLFLWALIISALAIFFSRGWRSIVLFILLVFYLVLPGFFMESMFSARYWILPSLTLCFYMAYAWPNREEPRWVRYISISCITLITSLMLNNSLTALPRYYVEKNQYDLQLKKSFETLQSGPFNIELTDWSTLTLYRQARNLCLVHESHKSPSACQIHLVLGGTEIEKLRDSTLLSSVCDTLPNTGRICVDHEIFVGNISKKNATGLSWDFKPCPSNGVMALIFNHDGRNTDDWALADVGCQGKLSIFYNWLEMMAIIDLGDNRTMITPIFRTELKEGEHAWQSDSIVIKPLPR